MCSGPSARWPWQKTAPKLKSFHRCTFSSVAVAKKRARRALRTFGTCADRSICLTFLRFRQGSFRGQKAVSMWQASPKKDQKRSKKAKFFLKSITRIPWTWLTLSLSSWLVKWEAAFSLFFYGLEIAVLEMGEKLPTSPSCEPGLPWLGR